MTYFGKRDAEATVSCHATSGTLPDYLKDTYSWAYLNPKTVPWLSSAPVVAAILWGNATRLIRRTTDEITPGSKVLQAAAVYGRFSTKLAQAVGTKGRLDVIDVAPIQVETARKRVEGLAQAHVRLGDASVVQPEQYDCAVCFFLLHEVPDDMKGKIVSALLGSVKEGGKLVFVDYHEPAPYHPLKPVMSKIFDWLEPFAKGMWGREIRDFAPKDIHADWQKETLFGGMYQKVVVHKR